VTSVSPDGCPRTVEAGTYLLGSLDPAERADYAGHLPHCPYCLREVGQLAGLPGLLARSPGPPKGSRPLPDVPASAPAPSAEEPSAVVAALREIRRRRTRRRTLLAASFALVAVVGVGATALTTSAVERPATGVTTGVTAAAQLPVQMVPEGGSDASAALALNDKAWGTEVVMRCRYEGSSEYAAPVLILVATAADGTKTELARWTAVADRDVVLATATDLPRAQLVSLQVQDTHGTVVLRTVHI